MTCSPRPGKQLEPGQAVAELAAVPARVAAPVLLSASPSQHDATDASCGLPPSPEDGASAGEAGDTPALSRTSNAEAAHKRIPPSRKLARPLLSSSPDGNHVPDDDRYMSLTTLSRYGGLSVRTLRAALRDPLHPLPHYRPHAGGKVLVRRSEFDAWMERCRVTDSADVDAIVRSVMDDMA